MIHEAIERVNFDFNELRRKFSNHSIQIDEIQNHVIDVAFQLNLSGNILDAVKVDLQTYAKETEQYDDMRYKSFQHHVKNLDMSEQKEPF